MRNHVCGMMGGSLILWVIFLPVCWAPVPGVVIDSSPKSSGIYIGSPSLAILLDDTYAASHDEFGPGSSEHTRAVTKVFISGDRGATWQQVATVLGQFWSTLFVHRGSLYLIGTWSHYGNLVIRRSDDARRTWTVPKDQQSGLLAEGRFHCAPVPVVLSAILKVKDRTPTIEGSALVVSARVLSRSQKRGNRPLEFRHGVPKFHPRDKKEM